MTDNTKQTIDNADPKQSAWNGPLVYIERITDKAQYHFARSLLANFVDDTHISLSLIQERKLGCRTGRNSKSLL